MKNKVFDLFCGCGGISKGFELAGFEVIGGIDFNKKAIETFNFNFKKAKGLCCDLLEMNTEKILGEYENIKDVDVLIGGPPCQGFSSANRWQKELEDPRNKLFFEFVKFVDLIKPKVVLIENVKGIITKNNGYARDRIYEIFKDRGYFITNKVLDASDYGVPQRRLRNFFIASKKELFDFNSVKKVKNKVSVQEAIGELYSFEDVKGDVFELTNKPQSDYQRYLRQKNNLVLNAEVRYPAEIVQKRISFVKQGENWQVVPKELWPTQRSNRHSSAYKRLQENEVSVTIDTGNNHSNYFHPLFNRIPTVREAARLQSFPDGFEFKGNRSEQYRQVGNAVPPLLAKKIAMAIKETLL